MIVPPRSRNSPLHSARPRSVRPPPAHHLSPLDLYERCVQQPAVCTRLLQAIHAGDPRILAEDFCGSAALARHWVRSVPAGRAIAVDADADVLAQAKARAARARPLRPRAIRFLQRDLISPPRSASPLPPADVLFVGNFSIGEFHDRGALVAYLRRARARLRPRRGVFVCDTYGGETAFTLGSLRRVHQDPRDPALRVHYTWQQRHADPLTARVENALHFRVERAGEIVQDLPDAFIYRWRLWSVPELRDALLEAGFRDVAVYNQTPDAEDDRGRPFIQPLDDPRDLDPSFVVCVAARA